MEKKILIGVLQEKFLRNKVDLLISVSKNEGIPVSFMEAMAYGIPVITTNVGAIKEIVNQSNGLIISKDPSPEEICNELQKFIMLSQKEKRELSKNAYQCWNNKFNLVKNLELMFSVNDN